MKRTLGALLLRSFLPLLLLAAAAPAQEGNEPRLRVPFGVGERLEYDVKFGKLKVGSGSIEVADIQEMRGHEAWHIIYSVQGGTFFYRVNDLLESWFDTRTGNSLKFRQDLNEGRRDVERIFDIFPDKATFSENGEEQKPSVHDPLDDGSFFFFIRTIPLTVGQTYTFNRYFRADRNPVTVKVVRKDTIDVPAGRFPAIVVQPTFKTSGIFSENGHAEIWLSDDANRIMLQMKSGLSFGSINLYLQSYRPAQAAPAPKAP